MSKFTYRNSIGETVDLCNAPLWVASFNSLRSHTAERIEQNGVFFGYKRMSNVEKPLKIQYYRSGREEFLQFRDLFYRIVNYDVSQSTYGTLYVGEWYGEGCFPSESVDTYDKQRGLWTSTIPFFMPSEVWRRIIGSFQFSGGQGDPGTVPAIPLANYPLNYPHGYVSGKLNSDITNPSAFPSPFTLTIYGQCSNPSVTIAGHVYNVNVNVPSGSRLVIDSAAKTIILYDADNNATNVFALQNHDADKYIFQPIPDGAVSVRYQNIPSLVLTLYEERSAPAWT